MDRVRRAFSTQEDEAGILSSVENGLSLSWSTRIKGFAVCFVLGIVFSILGSVFLWLPKGLILFALFYTTGNLLSLGSTIFLMGPMNQLRRMFQETRIFAAVIMLMCMAMTICAAVWWKNKLLCLIFCLLQSAALTWYSLSYIPFARDAVKACCTSMIV
ncbi:hypothetical protein CRM22_005678 [Opisthorchis felineus]|uniref:Vesicle transport protein n=1 Tax=Opisthorchis felineus TaxID=147828 RepID=A0A4S2LXD5_OPIFE|nr:hypothetical protein CRM22_005678 [Opisthorchis felineus]